jgi:3-phosphoshikimate 1-carboxyvinyltransferase
VSRPLAVLIGPPGAGKTTVGQLLASLLAVGFRDTDADIAAAAGKPVGDIFSEGGEPAFRALERDAVAAALREHPGVLGLGAGAVLDPGTQNLLSRQTVVYLETGFAVALRRTGMDRPRPPLLGNRRARLRQLLQERLPIYERLAVITVPTDGSGPEEIADEIAGKLATTPNGRGLPPVNTRDQGRHDDGPEPAEPRADIRSVHWAHEVADARQPVVLSPAAFDYSYAPRDALTQRTASLTSPLPNSNTRNRYAHCIREGVCGGQEERDWAAPTAAGPIRAVVTLQGSKSITNRALVLAALADGPGLIRRPLRSRDTLLMADAMRALGADVGEHEVTAGEGEGGAWHVRPLRAGAAPAHASTVDIRNAGTVLRFVPPAATLTAHDTAFDGDPRARERPVAPLITALRELGATIEDEGRGALPFVVRGRGGLPGGTVVLDASSSSQLISALLLTGACFSKGVEVRHDGPPVPSAPHIAMTTAMLRAAGVQVECGGRTVWRVHPGPVHPRSVEVEPDLSNAAPFLAAALVTGGSVTVAGWPTETAQPGDALRELLTGMGGICTLTADGLTVEGSGTIHGIAADLREVSELVTVLTALASSPSRFTGIAHTRTHETDRLAALACEINVLGGEVAELPDGLTIRPRPLRAKPAPGRGVFETYDDHRMAMAGAVLGLVVPGLRIANIATVAKTLPGFTRLWSAMPGVDTGAGGVRRGYLG